MKRLSAGATATVLALLAAGLILVVGGSAGASALPDSPSSPDLIVQQIEVVPVTPKLGDTATVRVTIRNEGTQDVPPGSNFWTDLYIDPAVVPIAPGQVGTYSWPCQATWLPAGGSHVLETDHVFDDVKAYSLYAQVDTDEHVAESNEDNNVTGPVIVQPQSALITALYYNTFVANERSEAFRLTNSTGTMLDITNWTITDGEGVITLTGTLLPDDSIWIAREATAFLPEFGFWPQYEYDPDPDDPGVPNLPGAGSLALANGGDELILYDDAGLAVDTVIYESGNAATVGWHGPTISPYGGDTYTWTLPALATGAYSICGRIDGGTNPVEWDYSPGHFVPSTETLPVLPAPDMITVDGNPDETAWGAALPLTYALHDGQTDVTTATVRALWDADHLYLAFQVQDGQVETADQDWDDDSVSLVFDNGEFRCRQDAGGTGEGDCERALHLPACTTLDNPADTDCGYTVEMRVRWNRARITANPGDIVPADLLSVDHDGNPGAAWDDLDTEFSKRSWDTDARVDTTGRSLTLVLPEQRFIFLPLILRQGP